MLSLTISVMLTFGAADSEKDMSSKNMYIASMQECQKC